MHRSPNRATPFTAATVLVPDRVAFPAALASWPIAIVTSPVKSGTAWPWLSTAVTSTGGAIVEGQGVELLGWTVNASAWAGTSQNSGPCRPRRGLTDSCQPVANNTVARRP